MIHPYLLLDLPSKLKEETSDCHAALEDRMRPYLETAVDAPGYARLLKLFFGFYAPLEQAIETHLSAQHLNDLPQRRKASLILEDLNHLGESKEGIALCMQLPVMTTAAEAWGALYVLEGSTLGGRSISRMIRAHFPGAPLRFFEGYGKDTGPYWLRFQEALRQFGRSNDPAPLIRTANETFQCFDLWIQTIR